VFDDANAMLKQIIEGKWLTAKGIVGIYPANAVGDDVHVYAPEDAANTSAKPAATFCMLRQQAEKETTEPYLALSGENPAILPRPAVQLL
jgi:5-methyltetrahydrofolate--homocysteine methyltransferase